jgi:hypothetical protein
VDSLFEVSPEPPVFDCSASRYFSRNLAQSLQPNPVLWILVGLPPGDPE